MRFILPLLFTFFIILSSQSGCRKDPINDDSSVTLRFSEDTIVFDTVFTTIGSSTRQFKVYNDDRKAVNITSISLAGGSTSNFHLNIDGVPAVSTGDILLRGGDSMYIFVDVMVDPNNSNSPLMIEDSVQFVTNGNRQHVVLNAVGQDAYFHYNTYLNCNEVWTNDKPHVIYNYAIVPSCCTLTMMPGTRVHLHKNGILAVDSCATLRVLGAQGNTVTFQGDRLEPEYDNEPGQWNFIWLSSLSKDNEIDWAVIRNGNVGILSDSSGGSANPTVRITNTRINNMALAGIYGRDSWIEGDNVAVSNCAQYCVAIAYGGKCKFRHCSFGNYWSNDSRTSPSVLLNNWYEVNDLVNEYRDLFQADFYNCIIYGDLENELGLDSNAASTTQFNYFFKNCLIKTNVNTSSTAHFLNNRLNLDPYFIDGPNNNLHIGLSSNAKDFGDSSIGILIPFDLDNVNRTVDGFPDIGAYEYAP